MIYQKEQALGYRYNGEILEIVAWGKNSLRIRAVMQGEIINTDYALLEPEPTKCIITVQEDKGEIINGKIRALLEYIPGKKDCLLSVFHSNGKLLLKEYGDGGALRLKSREFKPRIGGDFSLTVSFASDPEEKLYGMGQYQQTVLDWKGSIAELAHRNSQVSIPFVLSDRGYGFLWHNPAIGKAVFGKNITQWYSETARQMDYWITAGDEPAEILKSYANATGKVPEMPEYGLGFWQSKLRYWNQKELLQIAEEYHKRGIPLDVIVCDFFHWTKLGDFKFDREFFPEPEQMVQRLKELGIQLMVSVWPEVAQDSENREEMQEKGLLIKPERGVDITKLFGGNSSILDPTNKETREFVWEKCKKNYYDMGIHLFWLDDAEPNYSALDFDNYRLYMGSNLQIGNLFPQMYARIFYEGMQQVGMDAIVNLVRCGWAGSQRYGALIWSGDIQSTYEDLRKQLCAGLSMAVCGIPWWTTDIGGFTGGDPNNEGFRKLLLRWFEWGTFCPVMRLHGDRIPSRKLYHKNGNEAMFTGGENEIWSFGEDAYEVMTKYIRIREKLRPYLRKLMKEAHIEGAPIMRPMFYEFPYDKNCWSLQEQYMLGDTLLVAPILYENTFEKDVYLPLGSAWYSLLDKRMINGGVWLTISANIDEIPVFVREDKMTEDWGSLFQ